MNLNYISIDMGEEVDVEKIISKLLENGGKDVKLLES